MPEVKKLNAVRVFADNFQFYVYDPSKDPFEPMPEIDDEQSKRGWTRNENSIWYFTVGELNDHRVDIFLGDTFQENSEAERLLVHNLSIESGSFAIYDHEEDSKVEVPAGDYAVYLQAFNLGVEDDDEELEDEEFFKRDDLERYEILLIPGLVDQEGVIAGKPALH